jgi:hypothetical protein
MSRVLIPNLIYLFTFLVCIELICSSVCISSESIGLVIKTVFMTTTNLVVSKIKTGKEKM